MSANQNSLGTMMSRFMTPYIQNAQFAPTDNRFMDIAMPVLSGLGRAATANANGQGVLIPFLSGGAEAFAKQKAMGRLEGYYNQAYKDQQTRQTATDANNAALFGMASGHQVQGPFDTTFANNMLGSIRQSNAAPSINTMLQGGALQLDPYGNYDNTMIQKYLEQQQAATNYLTNSGISAIQAGQGASRIGNPAVPVLPTTPPSQGQAVNVGRGQTMYMDNSLGNTMQPMLNANAAYSAPAQQIPMNISPFLLPTDVPTNVAAQERAGLGDAQEAGKLSELTRSNKADEANAAKQAQAAMVNANAHMIQAQKYQPGGGGGGAFSLNEAMWSQMSPEQRQQWMQRTAMGQQSGAGNDPTEELLGNNVANAKAAFGEGSNEAKAAYQQYASYVNQKQSQNYVQNMGPPIGLSMQNPLSRIQQMAGPSASGMVARQSAAGAQGVGQIRSAGDWLKNRGR